MALPGKFRCLIATFIFCSAHCLAASGQEAEPTIEYRRDILPILSERCFACHGFDEQARQAGLRLDIASGATAEADSGLIAIVPARPDDSELILRISSDDPSLRMPPADTGPALSPEQQSLLRKWIEQGAEFQEHWSFEKPLAIEPPPIADVQHPIDRFIQARLKQANVEPSPRANAETLMRRVSLDLVGLPPSVEEIDRYLEESAEDPITAYHQAVERLLASPHYGERWGRWWLDQARYADSNGYSVDAPRQIWPFRDWVIQALNDDMPFDQFTIEQLAGDLLPDATLAQKVATGFHRNTQINQEGGIDPEQFRVDSIFDRVATTGTVWLGLTVGCAQCHDHKFDPISQKEYYQLFAFFNNQDEPTINYQPDAENVQRLRTELAEANRELDQFIADHAEAYHEWESGLTEQDRQTLSKSDQKTLDVDPGKRNAKQKRQLFATALGQENPDYRSQLRRVTELEDQLQRIVTTLVMQERTEPRSTTVLIKGDFTRPADEVQPATPSVLHPLDTVAEYPTRLDLARWITSPENPLTARVIVNRVWQVYFGRGMVETENDFGMLGTAPSHPELLDWLAVEFVENGWSLKDLHRLIVTSHTYQQSSKSREDLRRVDPNNYLLARQQRLRLEAEIIRDVCLSLSGLLSPKMGGPPVYPPIPAGVMNRGQVSRQWKVSQGEDRYRRGIYTFVYRATPPPSLKVFDAPDGFSTCTRRSRSNTPLQALTLLNDEAFVEFATSLKRRIEEYGLKYVFRHCTGRRPTPDELAVLEALDTNSIARVLLNLDETVTRD